MVMDPYFPDIMQGVVARVSAAMQARVTDPFSVFFDKGIYGQVSRSVVANGPDKFPLVWLVFPFHTHRGNFKIYGDIACDLILAMPTKAEYTQQQRDDESYKPRLLPVYVALLQEIAKEKSFSAFTVGSIPHDTMIRPYWGGGDVNGSDTDNLFKTKVDAISISNMKLCVKLPCK